MINIAFELQQDCAVILDRVLTGQHLTFFGEDGNGQHGRSTFPVTARVRSFHVDIERFSDDYSEIDAFVYIFLDGYRASDSGHAITDQNLRINLNTLLQAQAVDPLALDWGPLDLQAEDRIVLKVDVQRMLSW